MTKVRHFLLWALLLLTAPQIVAAQNEKGDGIESEVAEVVMEIRGTQVHLMHAENKRLEIYNITGVCIETHRIEGNDVNIRLTLQRGYYFLKVGKVVRKISIP